MRTDTIGMLTRRSPRKLRGPRNYLSARPQFDGTVTNNHRGVNQASDSASRARPIDKGAAFNSLWVKKIGDRVVGMARLVQAGPHSAEIVLFRIDPEWSHTKVPVDLIHSIEVFCKRHGRPDVTIQPHTAPPWILALMSRHGFHFSTENAG
jgi:hypothetical protein